MNLETPRIYPTIAEGLETGPFITAFSDADAEQQALELGVTLLLDPVEDTMEAA